MIARILITLLATASAAQAEIVYESADWIVEADDVSRSNASEGPPFVSLRGVEARGFGTVLISPVIIVREAAGGGPRFVSPLVEIRRGAADGETGNVVLSDLEFEGGPQTLERVVALMSGSAIPDCASGSVQDRIEAGQIHFLADSDGLPDAIGDPESVRLERAMIDLSAFPEEGICETRIGVSSRTLAASGVDDTRFVSRDFEVVLGLSGSSGMSFDLDARDISLLGGRGAPRMGSLSLTGAHDDVASLIGENGALLSPAALMDGLATNTMRVAASAGDVFVDPENFLPDDIRRRTGLDGHGEISGDLSFDIRADGGDLRLEAEMDMANVATGDAAFSLSLGGSGGIPGMLTDRLPIPPAVLAAQFGGAHLAYEDAGLNAVLRTVLGREPGDIVRDVFESRLAPRLEADIPGAVAPVRDGVTALAGVLEDGGRAALEPGSSVGAAQVGMTMMLDPESLGSVLGASLEASRQEISN